MLTNNTDVSNLRRYSTHVGVILLILAALLISRMEIPKPSYGIEEIGILPSEAPDESVTKKPLPLPVSFLSLSKAPVPRTTIPERPRESIMIYKVEPGDTLYGIGQKFGIGGETVMWANEQENNPDVLSIGQELIILPVSGVYHTVQKGDTVESIAAKYQVNPSAITQFAMNGLKPPFELTIGEKIIVPGGQKPYVPRVVAAYQGPVPTDATRGTGRFGWPASGLITQIVWGGQGARGTATDCSVGRARSTHAGGRGVERGGAGGSGGW